MTLQRFETAMTSSTENTVKEIHTALPGTILSFDPATQLCEVQLGIQRIFLGTKVVTIPPLINAPLAIWKGGGFAIMFPVEPGDECMVIFAERSIDRWLQNGGIGTPLHMRTHDLSDGVVFPCLASQPHTIPGYDGTNMVIGNLTNGAQIKIDATGDLNMSSENATLTVKQNGGIELMNNVSGQSLLTNLVNLTGYLSMEPTLTYTTQYATIKANLLTFG